MSLAGDDEAVPNIADVLGIAMAMGTALCAIIRANDASKASEAGRSVCEQSFVLDRQVLAMFLDNLLHLLIIS